MANQSRDLHMIQATGQVTFQLIRTLQVNPDPVKVQVEDEHGTPATATTAKCFRDTADRAKMSLHKAFRVLMMRQAFW